MVRGPAAGSRANLLIRLRRAAEGIPDLGPITLSGAPNGDIRISGDGFWGEIGADAVRNVHFADDPARKRFVFLLRQAEIPLPEELENESSFDPV